MAGTVDREGKLLVEVEELRQKVAELTASERECKLSESELRRSEERLLRAYHDLEKRIEERTAQLTRVIENLQEKIVQQRKTEEALRRSEERYALVVDGTNDGIWDRDFVSGEIYYSPRWKSLLGYQDDEIRNDRDEWLKRIHPDDRDRVRNHLNGYLQGEVPAYEIEYRMRHKDGGFRWILAKGICLRNAQGYPYRMAGSHTDITAKKQAVEELRKNEELLRTILETLPVGVSVFDLDGKRILENQAKRAIWGGGDERGVTLEDYKGWFVDSGEAVKKEQWPVYRACSEGGSESAVFDIEGFDGSRRSVIISATPLKINDRIVAGIGVIEDITEMRMLEDKLAQAQKMESIGLLAGGMAHEFNNLLTAVSGYAEELLESDCSRDRGVRSSISGIMSASKEAAGLISNLLAFSRQQIFTMGPVVVNDLIRDAGKILARILGKGVVFKIELCGENPVVMADGVQLTQVLLNLAVNARDAMQSGGKLKVRTGTANLDGMQARQYALPEPGCYATITISDSGAGMDDRTMEKIFEPFFTTKEFGKGTGLGLSIAYGIVRQHKGAITVDSCVGQGSTFSIYLPHADSTPAVAVKEVQHPPCGGGETILVAEDEELVRQFLVKSLEREGYRIISAVDGEEAVKMFAENRDDIALVVSDMVMPKKSGREMYAEISKIKPGISILFITGYSADMMKVKGEDDESLEFITKPFTKKDILTKARTILDRIPSQHPPAV